MSFPRARTGMPRQSGVFLDSDKIEKGLYLGNINSATNEDNLKKLKITHVLSAYHLPLEIPGNVKSLQIYVADCDNEDILTHFDETNQFIRRGQTAGTCLVHCHAGVSRSASFVIAYLMNKYQITFDQAKAKVKYQRHYIYPNAGFTEQLQLYESMGSILDKSFCRYKIYGLQHLSSSINKEGDFSKVKSFLEGAKWNSEGDVFKCKKCRQRLFSEGNLLSHEQKKTLNWRYNYPKIDSELCQSSLYIEALPWMTEALTNARGKINCPQCQSKIGNFSWPGEPCLCAAAICPAFKVSLDRVDREKEKISED